MFQVLPSAWPSPFSLYSAKQQRSQQAVSAAPALQEKLRLLPVGLSARFMPGTLCYCQVNAGPVGWSLQWPAQGRQMFVPLRGDPHGPMTRVCLIGTYESLLRGGQPPCRQEPSPQQNLSHRVPPACPVLLACWLRGIVCYRWRLLGALLDISAPEISASVVSDGRRCSAWDVSGSAVASFQGLCQCVPPSRLTPPSNHRAGVDQLQSPRLGWRRQIQARRRRDAHRLPRELRFGSGVQELRDPEVSAESFSNGSTRSKPIAFIPSPKLAAPLAADCCSTRPGNGNSSELRRHLQAATP
jgi:hypothetical protein